MIITLRSVAGAMAFQHVQPHDRAGCRAVLGERRCEGSSNHLGPHMVGIGYTPNSRITIPNHWVRPWLS